MTLRGVGGMRTGLIFVGATLSLLAVAVLINLNFGLPLNLSLWPPGQDYVLKASFKDANGVTRGADVEIAGHNVGQVTAVAITDNRALVSMRINQAYAPLHRGSIARIRYSTLLAQKYIELAAVGGSENIANGGTIPSNETVSPVDFDQFLSALDQPTRQKLQVIVQQAGSGVDGRHADINDLLDQLHALSISSQPPLDTLAGHTDNLDRIVTNLSVAGDRLAQSHENLGQLVQSADDVNGRLADQNAALAGLIRHLANLMTDFNATLDGNEGNLHQTVVLLDPLVGQLSVTFGTTDAYMAPNLPNLKQSFARLVPEGESAISQCTPACSVDAGGNYLRQYLVYDQACDQINDTYNPKCGTGASSSPEPLASSQSPAAAAAAPAQGGGTPSAPTPAPTCDPLNMALGRCH